MGIVGGEWRSRRIDAPAEGLRPTADRVREAVFNMLANVVDLEECTVCDLFAGSGAMGIEALSRGATHATFVEQHAATAAVISNNLVALHAEERATVTTGDAFHFVNAADAQFDIVFADPPYAYPHLSELVDSVIARALFRQVFLVEHSSSVAIRAGRAPWRERQFGASAVTIFRNDIP